jgi:hypothetical protein
MWPARGLLIKRKMSIQILHSFNVFFILNLQCAATLDPQLIKLSGLANPVSARGRLPVQGRSLGAVQN